MTPVQHQARCAFSLARTRLNTESHSASKPMGRPFRREGPVVTVVEGEERLMGAWGAR